MEKKDKKIVYIMLIVSIVFHLMWFWIDGIRMGNDTDGYIHFAMAREPLYPVFLAFFRLIFGVNHYLQWVGVFQCLLWGVATWYFCTVLYRKINMSKYSYVFLVFIFFGAVLMTRFLANRKMIYALDIMTEAVVFPLYFLFVLNLFLYISENRKQYFWGTFVFSILLVCTRKQMYMILPVMILIYFIDWIIKRTNWKEFALRFLSVFLIIGISMIVEYSYNYILRGQFVKHSSDSWSTTLFYTAEPEDAECISDQEVRALFSDIVSEKVEKGWGFESYDGKWTNLYSHYAEHFDLISYGLVKPEFYEFLEEKGIHETVDLELAFGKLNNYIISCLFKNNSKKFFTVYLANMVAGFSNTVAKNSVNLYAVIALLYVSFGGLLFVQMKREGKEKKESLLGLIVAVCILSNVLISSLMIFSQSRYMIYNMPLFYCAYYLLIRKITKKRMN